MQRAEGLLDGRAVIPAVDLVEVDVVGAQAAQGGIELRHDRLAGQPAGVAPSVHGEVHLGGDHHFIAVGHVAQGPPDDLLAGAQRIGVGRVEEVDAKLQRPLDDRAAGGLVDAPVLHAARLLPEAHAAEADAGDIQAGVA